MSRYTLQSKVSNVVTFKCAACGVRKSPETAYNLSLSACSEECFEESFILFAEANGYIGELDWLRDIVKDNPVPLY